MSVAVQSLHRAGSRPRRNARTYSWAKAALWMALLLGAMFAVVWRQTRGVDLERALREAQMERAIAEAERLEMVRRMEALNSRARIVRVAGERLGMHLPGDGEIVFLPAPEPLMPGTGVEP